MSNIRFGKKLVYFAILVNFIANLVVILLFAHVQIVVRTMCCSPLIYCYIARKIRADKGFPTFEVWLFGFYSVLSSVLLAGSYGFA